MTHKEKKINKIAFITGASRGLGFAFADQLLDIGYRIAICSASSHNIQLAYDKLKIKHPESDIFYLKVDMTKEQEVEHFFKQALDYHGRIDLLINNVGYLQLDSFENTDYKKWQHVVDLNLTSCYFGSYYAFRQMKTQPGVKHILNISSLSGIRFVQKFGGMSAYIASKHAVVGLTESLAVEGKEHGIHVNCLAPGSIKTDMFSTNFPQFNAASDCEKVVKTGLKLCLDHSDRAISGCVLEMISDTL